MNLADDEIRVKCALAMGWAVPVTRDKYPTHGQLKTGDDSYQELPRFTTSVDAALALCDRLREEDFDILITIEKAGYTVNVYIGQMALVEIEDPSLARAVCFAFLKVHESRAS